MSLEYAREAVQEGRYEESQAWALYSIAEDLYAIRALLGELALWWSQEKAKP